MVDLIICPGLSKMYAVAEVGTDGWMIGRLSEHDTPTAALDARDNAKAAAADALIALSEIARPSREGASA